MGYEAKVVSFKGSTSERLTNAAHTGEIPITLDTPHEVPQHPIELSAELTQDQPRQIGFIYTAFNAGRLAIYGEDRQKPLRKPDGDNFAHLNPSPTYNNNGGAVVITA